MKDNTPPAAAGPNGQRLSAGNLDPLTRLVRSLGLSTHFLGDAVLHGSDPVIRSPHRLGEASGMAQLLIGIAGSAIQHARTGMGGLNQHMSALAYDRPLRLTPPTT